MSYLGRYERSISRRPWPFIGVILLVTMAMLFYSSKVTFDAGEDSFSPDTEAGEANKRVREEYGTQANQVTVLIISDDNVLSRDSLDAMLELEGLLLESKVAEHLVPTPTDPDGIASPVDVVVLSRIIAEIPSSGAGVPVTSGTGDGASGATDTSTAAAGSSDLLSGEGGELARRLANLSVEQKKSVLNGGNLTIEMPGSPVPLSWEFEPYDPSNLESILGGSPLGEALEYTVSRDFDLSEGEAGKALMSVSLDPGLDEELTLELQHDIQDMASQVEDAHDRMDVRVSGDQLTSELISEASGASTGILMMLAFTLVFVILALVYRDIKDTALNFAALGMAILWVFGFVGLFGLKFNPALTAVPILLIGLGIDYGIHFNLRYREELRWGKDISSAMDSTGTTVGFAIMLSTITTVVGFMSNATSDIPAIRDFGVLCAVGIISSFIIMITFFPAVKVVVDRRKLAKGKPLIREKKTRDRGWGWAAEKMRIRIRAIRERNRAWRVRTRERGKGKRNAEREESGGNDESKVGKGKRDGKVATGARDKKGGGKTGKGNRGDRKGKGAKEEGPLPVPTMVCASGVDSVNTAMGTGAVAARHPVAVFAVIALVTSVGAYGAMQLEPRFDFRDFLPEGLEVTETTEIILDDFEFSSTETVFVLVEGDVTDPDVVRAMEEVASRAEDKKTTVPTQQVQTPLRMARSLADPSAYPYDDEVELAWTVNLDQDRDGELDPGITADNVTAVYSVLFHYDAEGTARLLHRTGGGNDPSGGGSRAEDGGGGYRYDGAVVRIPVDTKGNTLVSEVADDMTDAAKPLESLEGGPLDTVVVTGSPILSAYTFESINEGQLRSILITILAALLILTVLYAALKRGVMLGFVTIAPLLLVVVWTLGAMYYLGIPLSPVTVTIAAITVGLGIDYSIHMTQRFLEDIDRTKDVDCALCVSTNHTGSALFGSMATTVLGFSVLIFALLPPLKQLGEVLALSVTFSFIAAVFVLPTFLRLWYNGRVAYLRRFKGIEPDEPEGTCTMPEDGPSE